jgi:shikimate kinase
MNLLTPQRFFLIGPMGAGKTTVGRALALALNFDFYDVDTEIKQDAGVPDVASIFEAEGESGFRHREAAMLGELTERTRAVVSPGAGAVLSASNRQALSARGHIIYLQASIEQQIARIQPDRQRPLLNAETMRETLIALNLKRTPYYEELAHMRCVTDGKTVATIVDEITACV